MIFGPRWVIVGLGLATSALAFYVGAIAVGILMLLFSVLIVALAAFRRQNRTPPKVREPVQSPPARTYASSDGGARSTHSSSRHSTMARSGVSHFHTTLTPASGALTRRVRRTT